MISRIFMHQKSRRFRHRPVLQRLTHALENPFAVVTAKD
jgi:hypothetical protein